MSGAGKNEYVALLPVDYTYQIHWNQGIDWDHVLIFPDYDYQETDKTIILRFVYEK